ncbi:hypothetical protein Tco_0978560 [Tanacetum coccineum]|uniref:Uncharacterized protein n=1 Tax=Tanacetum coccineum TaxID=301880 RepID=A0ABQ5ENR2_9ASTR
MDWRIKDKPWVMEKPFIDRKEPFDNTRHICEPFCFMDGSAQWPTCYSNVDGFCNGGTYWEWMLENHTRIKKELGDDELVNDYLARNDTPFLINEKDERRKEERCKLLGIPYTNPPSCKTKRFKDTAYWRPVQTFLDKETWWLHSNKKSGSGQISLES